MGDKIAVSATFQEGSGCNFQYDLVGIKLGAKILGIDENRFVTLKLSTKGMRIIDKKGIDEVLKDMRSRGEKV